MIKDLKEKSLKEIFEYGQVKEIPEDRYTNMSYPKLIKLMKFRVDRYTLTGFGHLMIMHTTTKMGMELLTMSFMPSECVNLPYLLIDAMTVKNKRCVFVEYYGCGNTELNDSRLKDVYEKYKNLPDYTEKDNWYIRERTSYSMIKSGEEDELINMAIDSIKAYLKSVSDATVMKDYKNKLEAFRNRMINEGNPSSATLKLILKEDGAKTFMEKIIMPI